MEIVDFLALTIVALIIFMIVYKFYFKKTHRNIRSVNTKSVSASSPQCIPNDGSSRTHECIATYSMDIQINEFDTTKKKHIFSALSGDKLTTPHVTPLLGNCVSFDKLKYTLDSKKNRLTLELGDKINELIVTSKYLDSTQTYIVKNIPLQKWVNITVVMDNDRLEVFVSGKLEKTLLYKIVTGKREHPSSEKVHMYATQMGGFEGYIRNIQYIPDVLSTREVRNLMGQSDSGAGSMYNTVNKALNKIIELPGKYFYNYDNGSCV